MSVFFQIGGRHRGGRQRRLGACMVLATAMVAGDAAASDRFAVVARDCPGRPMERVRRPLPMPEATGECQERVIAVIDPGARPVDALSTAPASVGTTLQEKPGWPRTFFEFSGGTLTLANLGDPRGLATVVDQQDGTVHALAPDGQAVPGWPVPLPAVAGLNVGIAAADLLGDGRDELLLAARNLQALSSDGDLLPGWPFTLVGASPNIPVAARMGPDEDLRVVGAGGEEPIPSRTAAAFVLDEQGQLLPGWPAVIPQGRFIRPLLRGPAVGDVTGDGHANVVVTVANESQVWVFDRDGQAVPPFPVTIGRILDFPSLGDLDGDGRQEIVFWTDQTDPGTRGTRGVIVLRGDGTLMPGWPQITNAIGNNGPALGDVDGDGRLEVVVSTLGGGADIEGGVYVWGQNGTPLPGFPKFIKFTGFPYPPVIADVDGDGMGDIVVAGGTAFLPADGVIYAWKGSGELIPGFPIVIPFRPVSTNGVPTIADIDGDGMAELGVTSDPGVFASKPGRIHWFDLGVPYRPEGMEWPTFAHDMARTGSYSPPVRRVAMEVKIAPPVLNTGTPAPKLNVKFTLPADEEARPGAFTLVRVDGAAVAPVAGTAIGRQGARGGPFRRLRFEFDGEAIRALLGAPGVHNLTFRSEVIGGLGGVQFQGQTEMKLLASVSLQ